MSSWLENSLRQLPNATTPQYAVRDWLLPFMLQFTDLLKIMWQLWSTLKRKQVRRAGEPERAGARGRSARRPQRG